MKILLAEDDRELSRVMVTILKMNKYWGDAVNNGHDALTYAENGEYDAIILDVMMPKKNGFEVLDALRNKRVYTPILMLTAKADTADRVYGLDLGADDYVAKPFEMEELLARLRAVTRRKNTAVKTCKFGDITLDVKNYTLSTGEKKETLSGKEYTIFKMLLDAEGNIVSTDAIIEKAWDYDNPADNSNVMIFITKLRKKMEAIGSAVTIKSVKGVGYCLLGEKE